MKRLLNTLYVTTQGSYLRKQGETIVVMQNEECKLRIPVHTLQGIICFGQVSVSPPLMGLCAERQVTISFLSRSGRFLARVEGPVFGNVLLRREQYRWADNLEKANEIARSIVTAKIYNSRLVLQRGLREHPENIGSEELAIAIDRLMVNLKVLEKANSLESIRGIEGEAARTYFKVFNQMILNQKEDFSFNERNRRPPLDNVNALLSFLYSVLARDVASVLETVGLNPAVGYLHRDRPSRPGLALDIMEEFRSYLADRLALKLINLKQISGKGFKKTETGAVLMDDNTRKQVIVSYQSRKQREITHPFLKEKVSVGLLPYIQALLLARYLRHDLDGYPPFLWR